MRRALWLASVAMAGCVAAPLQDEPRLVLQEISAFQTAGNLPGAIAKARELVRLHPDSKEGWLMLGGMLMNQDRAEEAAAAYDAVLQLAENHSVALTERALLHAGVGKYDAALALLDRLVAVHPDRSSGYLYRAYVLGKVGRKEEADRDAIEARARKGSLWGVHHNIGLQHFEAGRTKLAGQQFELAALLAPDRLEPLLGLGRVMARERNWERALASLTRGLELTPGEPEVLYQRGLVHIAMGRTAAALEDFDQSLESRPGHPGVLTARGLAHQAAAELEEAEQDFTAAIAADPDCREAYVRRALLRHGRQDLEAAEADYVAALAIRATAEDVRNLARIARDRNDQDRAISLYERALSLPASAEVRDSITGELEALKARKEKP